MGFEYRVIADKKVSVDDLDLICNNLKKCSLCHNAVLTKHGIYMPSETEGWEAIGIGLTDEGFFVTLCFSNCKTDKIVLDIIQNTMRDKGIKTVVEDN